MSEPLISVIVPVYNAEKYIEKCVASIRAQTYRNLEIILVDDGSCDRSGELCEAFALEDSRIVVIRKENGGVASARNAGLDAMHGDYVGFVDADDWIDPEMYEVLLQRMIAENAQISCCGTAIVTGEKITRYFNPDMDVQFTVGGADAQSELIRCSCITNAMCDKLYSAEIFDGLRQKTGAYMDDMAVQHLLCREGRAGNLHGTADALLVSVGKQYYTWAFYNALLRMDYQHRGAACILSGAFPGVCPGGLQSVYRPLYGYASHHLEDAGVERSESGACPENRCASYR